VLAALVAHPRAGALIRTRTFNQQPGQGYLWASVTGSRRPPIDSFVRAVALLRDKVESFDRYPFSIPAIRALEAFDLHPQVTFFVGENGSGKSTLVEAIAIAAGFNAEGGSRNFNFATRRSESVLHTVLRLVRGVRRPKSGYFLRAESYFNVATEVDANPDALAEHYALTRDFLMNRDRYLRRLLGDGNKS